MKRLILCTAAIIALAVLASCGQDQSQSDQVSYHEVKTMVLDILKTEDGQKAVREASFRLEGSDAQKLQILSTGQGQQLQTVVREILSDPAYAVSLKEAMIDPIFAAEFAKAIKSEDKKIHMELLKDPGYQKEMIQLFKSPEVQTAIMETMKGAEYREMIMTVMKESLETPIFRQEMLKLMERALEEHARPKPDEEKAAKAKEGDKTQEDTL